MATMNSVSLFGFRPYRAYSFTGYRFAMFSLLQSLTKTKLNRESHEPPNENPAQQR
ncbi:MAG: hypothetical protein JSR17_12010 [Proteobacteria bacterium]|nr:hypothetical protein [Pseudomonadota bacterium]